MAEGAIKTAAMAVIAIICSAAINVSVCFADYHKGSGYRNFKQVCREYRQHFAPSYNPRCALRKGVNRIYAYTICDKPGQIKIGMTTQKTMDRLNQQLRTANIYPHILWEIRAQTKSGKRFTDTDFHKFLVSEGYEQIRRKSGKKRQTEWFQISPKDLHKEFYKFYITH